MSSKDNIYNQVRLVLAVNCICGLFSVKNCFGHSCKNLIYKVFSWYHVYSLALIISSLTITIIIGGSHRFCPYRKVKFTVQCEYVMWMCVMCYTNKVYITVLSKVEAEGFKNKFSSVKPTNLWIYLVYILHLLTHTCGVYWNIQNDNREWIQYLVEFVESYMVSIRTLATLPYIVTISAIGEIFCYITKEFQDQLSENDKYFNDTLIKIEKCRLLHLKLCTITEWLISCFSLPITLFFGLAYFDMLVKVGRIVENKKIDTLVDPMVLTITSLLGYLIISASEDLFQASQRITNVIQELPVSNKSTKYHIHLKQFTMQIKSTAIKVSPGNYFLLRKRTFPGIVGSMTSFLVVVIQLNPYYNHLSSNSQVDGNATKSIIH